MADNLWAQQLDAQDRMEEAWAEIQRYLVEVFRWAGVEGLEAEELSVVPGLDEIFALSDIKQHATTGDWDVLVVDCAPTAETIRLLSLPDVLGRYMERVFPMGRRLNKVVSPLVSRLTSLPVAGDDVWAATERFYERLAGVRELLTDGRRASVRLVVNPERMVIAEARRTHTYLSLFGYHVDAVVANRLLPDEVSDPWFARWKAAHAEHLAAIDEGFAPVPVLRVPLQPAEQVGPEALRGVRRRPLRRRGSHGPVRAPRAPAGAAGAGPTCCSRSICRSPTATSSSWAGRATSCSCAWARTAGRSCCPTPCAAARWWPPACARPADGDLRRGGAPGRRAGGRRRRRGRARRGGRGRAGPVVRSPTSEERTMSPSNLDGETTAGASARARQGVEHLQTAARELIEAARAALDVAEEVVNDPETLASLAGSLATMGDVARRVTAAPAAGRHRRAPGRPGRATTVRVPTTATPRRRATDRTVDLTRCEPARGRLPSPRPHPPAGAPPGWTDPDRRDRRGGAVAAITEAAIRELASIKGGRRRSRRATSTSTAAGWPATAIWSTRSRSC